MTVSYNLMLNCRVHITWITPTHLHISDWTILIKSLINFYKIIWKFYIFHLCWPFHRERYKTNIERKVLNNRSKSSWHLRHFIVVTWTSSSCDVLCDFASESYYFELPAADRNNNENINKSLNFARTVYTTEHGLTRSMSL